MSTEKRRRLPPEERKRQLVAIGLQELATRPIHALSVDRVAEIAGISRGLLFRYFPTKQDFYVAVVAA
ncbi:MAG: TetR/AcrR family transcriptional regulator, partial [Rhodococcus sp. (in: high G+C Gram-positive bacteria)]|nr:TetR/AcrR family transcriptional regulator [Rhodococcus sp. (in: high G+C Gram-positive bacteria)]